MYIYTVFDLLISVHPFLISRIYNYCNLISVEQLKSVAIWCYIVGTTFQFYTMHQMTPLMLDSYLIV